MSRISAALRRAGRSRGIDQAATDANVDEFGQAAAELFQTHPDYAIIISFPGLADSTGARVLAEIGDDRTRFADARALKAYAGSAPITRASGRSRSITHRRIKNDRLAAVGWMWAFAHRRTVDRLAITTGAAETTAIGTPLLRVMMAVAVIGSAACGSEHQSPDAATSSIAAQAPSTTPASATPSRPPATMFVMPDVRGMYWADVEPLMRSSCHVADRAGYVFEGVKRSQVLHPDGWHDMHQHARIATDPRCPLPG